MQKVYVLVVYVWLSIEMHEHRICLCILFYLNGLCVKHIWIWKKKTYLNVKCNHLLRIFGRMCGLFGRHLPCYNEQLLMEQYLPAACRVNTEELETIFEKIKRKRENESHQSIRYIFIHTQTFKTQAHTHSHRILTHQTKHYRHLRIHTSAQLHL